MPLAVWLVLLSWFPATHTVIHKCNKEVEVGRAAHVQAPKHIERAQAPAACGRSGVPFVWDGDNESSSNHSNVNPIAFHVIRHV